MNDEYISYWDRVSYRELVEQYNQSGQRGIPVPEGYKSVGIGYSQCRVMGNMHKVYSLPGFSWNIGEVPGADGIARVTSITKTFASDEIPAVLVSSDEVVSMNGIMGVVQNVVSRTNMSLFNGMDDSSVIISQIRNDFVFTANIITPTNVVGQGRYRFKQEGCLFRPKFMLPSKMSKWITFWEEEKVEESDSKEDVLVPWKGSQFVASAWGDYQSADRNLTVEYWMPEGILHNTENRTPLLLMTLKGMLMVDYLIEYRFYRD